MRKLFYIGALSALLLTACSEEEAKPKEETPTAEPSEVTEKPATAESKYPFPNASPIGNATITVSTLGGDSSNGNVPVLFVYEDDVLTEIDIEYENFDDSIETYVYINEIFSAKEQVGKLSQSLLNLSEDNLKPGDYTVTAVQFTDNDPTKEPVTLTEAKFKIEESK
ncbi:hypothetical protein ACIQZG_07750 [Lysinibacillus sp. NPDC096418]|uniref:hypothetical protein n=1 Tax=Lysinibacillus sp. NPDC096418 TaxID=3364138 RepID=UPI00382A24BD